MPLTNVKQYNSYMNEYMKNRWRLRRAKAIEYLGGKCKYCNTTENLEFHHKNKNTKVSTVAKLSSMNNKTFWNEVDKCELQCYECHKYEHSA